MMKQHWFLFVASASIAIATTLFGLQHRPQRQETQDLKAVRREALHQVDPLSPGCPAGGKAAVASLSDSARSPVQLNLLYVPGTSRARSAYWDPTFCQYGCVDSCGEYQPCLLACLQACYQYMNNCYQCHGW